MARPFKSGVDYFPLDVKMDDEVELLESEHNLIGFAVLIKLYQRIYDNNYWIKWDKKELIVFSKRVNVDKNEVNAIIDTCLEWGILDKKLFDKYSILTSNGIQKRFFEIVKRRTQLEIVEEFLLINVPTRERQEIVIADINPINELKSTQRKGKESKGKESKKTIINKPEKVTDQTWNDFINHRKNKKAPITQTVINSFSKESSLAGITLEDALIETMTRGWTGFKADWIKNKSFQKVTNNELPSWVQGNESK